MNKSVLVASVFCASLAFSSPGAALTLAPDFAAHYTVTDLGSITGLPANYGGLTFKAGDPNKILIGGAANASNGRIYEVGVARDAGNHVIGFNTAPTAFGSVGEYNDGGVAYGPGNVLFTSQWPVNRLGQTKPGSIDEDKVINLSTLGVANSHAALNFVPAGFSGAGRLKLVSWSGGQWYDANYAPDGSGTFNITSVTQTFTLSGGPEGFVYIDGLNPGFGIDSLLVSEYSAGTIGVYSINATGDPAGSRRDFMTGLTGAEGATIDPLTGDFLFSTFGGGNRVVRVSGFQVPGSVTPTPGNSVPEPMSAFLFASGLALIVGIQRRRRHFATEQGYASVGRH